MSAEIIHLPERRQTGNGAREAVDRWMNEVLAPHPSSGGYDLSITDHLLAYLWTEGFKIVPLDPPDGCV